MGWGGGGGGGGGGVVYICITILGRAMNGGWMLVFDCF